MQPSFNTVMTRQRTLSSKIVDNGRVQVNYYKVETKIQRKELTYRCLLCFVIANNPVYFPDLTPSNYRLFTKFEEHYRGKRFPSDNDVGVGKSVVYRG